MFSHDRNDAERAAEPAVDIAASITRHIFSPARHFTVGVRLNRPLVFIGAPARAYGEALKDYIELDVRVVPFHEVANAIGAISGTVRESVVILIRPENGGFTAYSPGERKTFDSLSAAKDAMSRHAQDLVSRQAREAGARDLTVDVHVDDKIVALSEEDEVYLETLVTATVVSVPLMK
jgi:N-methylhydantoinase A/oxoprolinase/acetone carboxylase beta subunit